MSDIVLYGHIIINIGKEEKWKTAKHQHLQSSQSMTQPLEKQKHYENRCNSNRTGPTHRMAFIVRPAMHSNILVRFYTAG